MGPFGGNNKGCIRIRIIFSTVVRLPASRASKRIRIRIRPASVGSPQFRNAHIWCIPKVQGRTEAVGPAERCGIFLKMLNLRQRYAFRIIQTIDR